MSRRVQKHQPLQISAAEYNRLLAAADWLHKNRLCGGATATPNADRTATVRIRNLTGFTAPIGNVLALTSPLSTDVTTGQALARFVRDITLNAVVPISPKVHRQFGVTIEPITAGSVGRVVCTGVAAARVAIVDKWHRFAGVANTGGTILESKLAGNAQILWRENPSTTGLQWTIVRISNSPTTRVRGNVVNDFDPGNEIHLKDLIGLDGPFDQETLIVKNIHRWDGSEGLNVRAEINVTKDWWEAYQMDCEE